MKNMLGGIFFKFPIREMAFAIPVRDAACAVWGVA